MNHKSHTSFSAISSCITYHLTTECLATFQAAFPTEQQLKGNYRISVSKIILEYCPLQGECPLNLRTTQPEDVRNIFTAALPGLYGWRTPWTHNDMNFHPELNPGHFGVQIGYLATLFQALEEYAEWKA